MMAYVKSITKLAQLNVYFSAKVYHNSLGGGSPS